MEDLMALSHHAVDIRRIPYPSPGAIYDTEVKRKDPALKVLNIPGAAERLEIRENEALICISTLFGLSEGLIHPEHYHLPIFMTAASGIQLEKLLEAWVFSGLFYDYNLVVLASDDTKQERQNTLFQHASLKRYPQALEHLAIYSDHVQDLQQGVAHYLKGQSPPFYFCAGPEDSFCTQAVNEGFLIIALDDLGWIEPNQNGFLFKADSAKSLALKLIGILENPAYDGEVLQEIADRARQCHTRAMAIC
jgi:hypothetical protein